MNRIVQAPVAPALYVSAGLPAPSGAPGFPMNGGNALSVIVGVALGSPPVPEVYLQRINSFGTSSTLPSGPNYGPIPAGTTKRIDVTDVGTPYVQVYLGGFVAPVTLSEVAAEAN